MTNPFYRKPTTEGAPAAQAPAANGYNPFAGSNTQEDRLPLLPGGVDAKVKVLKYRITPKGPTSGTYVFVDLELLEVFNGADNVRKPGHKCSFRIGGFESSGAGSAMRSLKDMNRAIFPELPEDTDFDTLPFQIQESGNAEGRVFYLGTKDKPLRSIDPVTGKPRVIVIGEFAAVEGTA